MIDNLKAPGAAALRKSAEAYLDMWERTFPPADAAPIPVGTTNGTVALGGACSKGDECKSGRCSAAVGKGVCVCNETADCTGGQYCDKGWLTVGENQCVAVKAICTSCTNAAQCGTGNDCNGVPPLAKCIKPGALAIGATCCQNDQCQSGQCDGGKCACSTDAQCGAGKYCDLGWLTVGKNQCVTAKAICTSCSDDKQCGPGNDCNGTIGFKKCIKRGALSMGAKCCQNDQCKTGQCEKDVCVCSEDSDCALGKKCKKGVAGTAQNHCE